ncbi:MAG: 4Fe-4S binding protein [candidate division FCPU426 bacterium]
MKRPRFSPWLRLLLVAAVAGWAGLGHWQRSRQAAETGAVLAVQQVDWETVLSLFPGAKQLAPLSGDPGLGQVKDAQGRLLGALLLSSPRSDLIRGYHGPTPLAIGLKPDGRIAGVRLLANGESRGFVRQMEEAGLLRSWDELPWQEAASLKVDAVTRATLTSSAVIRTLQHRLSLLTPGALRRPAAPAGVDWPALALLLAAAVLFLRPFPPARWLRLLLLLGSVLYLGIGRGWFLSLDLFAGWLNYGWSWPGVLVLALMAGLAVILALATRRPFYCYYVCPFGAAQELLFRFSPFKNRWPRPRFPWLKRAREALLAAGALLLLAGAGSWLSQLEPFAAFLPRSAGAWVLILAGLMLAVSLIWNRWWCTTFCPTGALLDGFCLRPPDRARKPARPGENPATEQTG